MRFRIAITKDSISVFLLSLLCIEMLSPLVERTVNDLVFFAIVVVYLLINVNELIACNRDVKKTILLILIYIVIILVYKVLGLSTASVAYHYNIVKFFLAFICFSPLYQRLNSKQITFLMIICLLTVLITLFQNYQLKMSLGYRYSIQLYKTSGIKEVIDTQYTSAILLLEGAFLSGFLILKKHVKRYLFLVLAIVLFAFNSVVTQRGTFFILTLLMILLLVYVNGEKHSAKRLVGIIVLSLGLVFVTTSYSKIIEWLGSVLKSNRIIERLNSINVLLQSKDINAIGDESLGGRIRLMRVSVDTFFGSISHFLLGVGNRTDNNVLVGNHSQFIDEFTRYGVLGGILFIVIIINMLKCSRKMSGIEKEALSYDHFTVICIVFILRGLIGTLLDASIGVTMFIIIPLLFRVIDNERRGVSI